MSSSATTEPLSRQALRTARQKRNKATLTENDWIRHKQACEQFVIYGGPRGNSKGRDLAYFIAQHG